VPDDLPAVDLPAQHGEQGGGEFAPVVARRDGLTAEEAVGLCLDLGQHVRPDGVEDAQGALVALPGGVAPGEQAVRAEQDPVGVGVLAGGLLQPKPQLEAGTLPGQPDQLDAGLLCSRSRWAGPLALAASAMAQSGWRWSTCL
jgi:hypothetical protein